MGEHLKKARSYIHQVLTGKIPCCKWVQMACRRQNNDLRRKRFDFYFDEDAAEEICWFISNLKHVKGEWAREGLTLELEPWQCFVLTTIFGWKRKSDHLRRFRTVYKECPRKNAKSTIAAGVGLYMLTMDGEVGAEVYSAAVTRDQSKIVWSDAKQMANKDPDFRRHYGVDCTAHAIVRVGVASRFLPLSSDSSSLEGLNVHCAIIDEVHAHKTRDVYDVLEVATGSRSQPLLWCVTTAGSNRAGICYELRDYTIKILQKIATDDTFWGCIWTLDDTDDWTTPAAWQKANPNYGVSIYPDDFERLARKAMTVQSATNNFLTKRLNIWVNADSAWMDMRAWDRAGSSSLKLSDFDSEPCYIGLDLASRVDIAAKVTLFRREIDGVSHYYAFGKYYLPESAVEEFRHAQYPGWARSKRLVLTPGNTIDFEFIKADLRKAASRFQIVSVPFDPFQAAQLSTELFAEGFPMIEVRPTVLNFSEPMKELEQLVLQGRFHHDNCPVLAWMVSNVVCHTDAKDNIYPRKERSENKIDGVVALLMALNRAMHAEAETSVYTGLSTDEITSRMAI